MTERQLGGVQGDYYLLLLRFLCRKGRRPVYRKILKHFNPPTLSQGVGLDAETVAASLDVLVHTYLAFK